MDWTSHVTNKVKSNLNTEQPFSKVHAGLHISQNVQLMHMPTPVYTSVKMLWAINTLSSIDLLHLKAVYALSTFEDSQYFTGAKYYNLFKDQFTKYEP